MLNKLILLIGIAVLISSCGDDEKDLKIFDSIRINIPNGINGSTTKLNIYIELDSIETEFNDDSEIYAFPTPFKQELSINLNLLLSDYYKIVVKNIEENKIYFSDERYFESGNYSYGIDPLSLNLPQGFYEVQLHRNLEIKDKTKVLYWNKDIFEMDEENNLLKVWSNDIINEGYFDINTDFKFLLNNELTRIRPDGSILQSYLMKNYLVIKIEDFENNTIKEKRIRFNEFASKNEFNFD